MEKIQSEAQVIVIVEDSEDDYEATLRAFRKANLLNPTMWCQTGWEAIDYLTNKKEESAKTGLILLDLNMPELDGRKTLKLIKGNEEIKKIPVIILTTSSDERDVEDCYKEGANTYIQKPVTFDGLLAAIMKLKQYWFEIALLPKEVL